MTICWQSKPSSLNPISGDTNIWRVFLPKLQQKYNEYFQVLTKEEIERAHRFYFQKDQDRFIYSRGILRTLLSQYLNIDPKKIKFVFSDHGKPKINSSDHSLPIHFNLSHSNECVMYAISFAQEVGIDVEYHKSIEFLKLAKRFFSTNEYQMLSKLSKENQKKIFYLLWTCKEAYVKAIGQGLFTSLHELEVELYKKDHPTTVNIKVAGFNCDYTIKVFEPYNEYSGALAIKNNFNAIHYWSWE